MKLCTGNGAPISLPNRNVAQMNAYVDTDDDDLSDISERSREEDVSEPISTKNSQTTLEKKDKPLSESLQSPTSGVYTPGSTSSATEKRSEPQALAAIDSDANQQEKLPPSTTETQKPIVKARRLEQSDSEDTTSTSDSHLTKQSGADTFYSPDESVDEGDDTDNQQAATLRQQQQQANTSQNKPTDIKSNQQKDQDDTEDDEDNDDSTSSSESEDTSAHEGIMALGEPYIYNPLGSLRSKY